NQALGLSNGRAEGSIDQTSDASTRALTNATVQYIPAGMSFDAAAVSNNAASTGAYGSQELDIRQRMTGDHTQASAIVSGGNAWDIQASTNAMANNATVYNQGGSVDVLSEQDNSGYLRAETVLSAYDFGAASGTAYGAANALEVGNNDVLVVIDSTQLNSGGVEVVAGFAGNGGYDVALGATAIGNTVTGYACSECIGYLDATNTQVNTGNVSATVTSTVGAGNRSVIGSATAVGNSATFYVTGNGGGWRRLASPLTSGHLAASHFRGGFHASHSPPAGSNGLRFGAGGLRRPDRVRSELRRARIASGPRAGPGGPRPAGRRGAAMGPERQRRAGRSGPDLRRPAQRDALRGHAQRDPAGPGLAAPAHRGRIADGGRRPARPGPLHRAHGLQRHHQRARGPAAADSR